MPSSQFQQMLKALTLLAHDCCFTLLGRSFAMRVSESLTPIFVPPVEMPAPCHVRLGGTTLKPCKSSAVCRTRLSLPYLLRSTHCFWQHDKGTPDAKVAFNRCKNGPNGIDSRCSEPTAPLLLVVDRTRRAFHFGELGLCSNFSRSCRRK